MDSIKRIEREIEAPERARAVIDLIKEQLGITIGPTEITEAAMSLSTEEKIQLAATLWAAAMPEPKEPTAGVYVLSESERGEILAGLRALDASERPFGIGYAARNALIHRLEHGDHA